MKLEHVVSNTACILVFAVFKQILSGDDEWLKLMDCMLKCTLEKGENALSKRNTVSRESHTAPYITIGNCVGAKKVSIVCPGIKEDIFCFL